MSAKRFGGAHSPGGAPATGAKYAPASRFKGRVARSVGIRSVLMFVLPTPLLLEVFTNLGTGITRGMVALLAYALLILGAWLLREGQVAEAAFNARQNAKPPAFPRKLCAALLTGGGVFIAVLLAQGMGAFLAAGLSAALATGCHIAAFGLDPMRAKGRPGETAPDYVTEAIDTAHRRVDEITRLAHTLRDREIEGRVDGLMAHVREMLRLVDEDPRDMSRARKYFTVYLKGAEDATQKYADNAARLNDPKLRTDYLALIHELETSFSRGREMLLDDDRADLEIEIEVLRERLAQEQM